MKPVLLLDRDGVVNEPPKSPDRYILRIEQLHIRKGVIEEIVRIQTFALVAFISNQQCIGKNLVSLNEVKRINELINQSLIDHGGIPVEFFICAHLEETNCACRKPKPGLLLQAINQLRSGDKRECLFVGDQEIDFEAAEQAKIGFQLVHNERSTIDTLRDLQPESFYKLR